MDEETVNPNIVTASEFETNSATPSTPVVDARTIANAITAEVQPKIDELNNKINDYKKEQLTILGIFASFITFVSVEFKLFEQVVKMGDFISLSILLVSLMMFFVITLQAVIKDNDLFYKKPIFQVAIFLMVIAIGFYLVPRIIETSQKNYQPQQQYQVYLRQ